MQKHGIIFWILIESLKNKVLKYLRFLHACKQKQYVQLLLRRIPKTNAYYRSLCVLALKIAYNSEDEM